MVLIIEFGDVFWGIRAEIQLAGSKGIQVPSLDDLCDRNEFILCKWIDFRVVEI